MAVPIQFSRTDLLPRRQRGCPFASFSEVRQAFLLDAVSGPKGFAERMGDDARD